MSSITRPARNRKLSRAQQLFVGGAAGEEEPAARRPVKKPPRKQISLLIAPDVLHKLDQMAARFGQSRTTLISIGIARVLRDGI